MKSFEQTILDAIHETYLRAEVGESSQREIAQALELRSSLNDYYTAIQDAILDGNIKFDSSVTVKADGKTIKFQSIEGVAEWITSTK